MQTQTIDQKVNYQAQSLLFNSWLKSLFTVQEFKEFEENELEEQITSAYLYDPFGRRIEKRVKEIEAGEDENENEDDEEEDEDDNEVEVKTQQYLYDNEDILFIFDDKGAIISRFVHGLGIDEPLAVTQKKDTYYYVFDGLGSVVGLTNKKGKVVQRYEYDSFGKLKQKGSKVKQPYAFTGREYDKETKLYYYRARYYDPEVGRFISRDAFGGFPDMPQTLNRYPYVRNNPVNDIDPSGNIIVGGYLQLAESRLPDILDDIADIFDVTGHVLVMPEVAAEVGVTVFFISLYFGTPIDPFAATVGVQLIGYGSSLLSIQLHDLAKTLREAETTRR